MSGLFVTLDGPGGVGKSTAVSIVGELLRQGGMRVYETAEPSRSTLGQHIRRSTEVYRGIELARLVAADRLDHVATEILPALARDEVVLCDRYIASSLALQCYDGVPQADVWELNRSALRPDLTVVLTADPVVIEKRLSGRGAHSRFERDPDSSVREVALFAQAVTFLVATGFNVRTVHCGRRGPDLVAAEVAAEIFALRKGPRAR